MKKTAALLAIGATVLGALAADRADDGRGLIEAYVFRVLQNMLEKILIVLFVMD